MIYSFRLLKLNNIFYILWITFGVLKNCLCPGRASPLPLSRGGCTAHTFFNLFKGNACLIWIFHLVLAASERYSLFTLKLLNIHFCYVTNKPHRPGCALHWRHNLLKCGWALDVFLHLYFLNREHTFYSMIFTVNNSIGCWSPSSQLPPIQACVVI